MPAFIHFPSKIPGEVFTSPPSLFKRPGDGFTFQPYDSWRCCLFWRRRGKNKRLPTIPGLRLNLSLLFRLKKQTRKKTTFSPQIKTTFAALHHQFITQNFLFACLQNMNTSPCIDCVPGHWWWVWRQNDIQSTNALNICTSKQWIWMTLTISWSSKAKW